jgi:hypothetical protein
VQRVGHDKAGRVLHSVPSFLSPRPSFKQVSAAFWSRAGSMYGGDVAAAAFNAFRRRFKPC